MKPIEFLRQFFDFQKDMGFDILKKLEFGIFGFSKDDSSLFWNTVLISRTISIKELREVELLMKSFQRKPCFFS